MYTPMALLTTPAQLVLLSLVGFFFSQAHGAPAAPAAAAAAAERSLAGPNDRPIPQHRLEVPDWSTGFRSEEAPQGPSDEEKPQGVTVEFKLPFPPSGSWAVGSFSGYGDERPMGPLLLSCTIKSPGRAVCEVVPENAQHAPGSALYRAWSMWGDEDSGRAYVSVLPGAPLGPQAVNMRAPPLLCCERSNSAPNCVACTGFPSPMYDPLRGDEPGEGPRGPPGGKTGPPKRRWPTTMDFEPARASDLFKILPNLREQLGGNPDPENLPCVPSGPPRRGLPTLGDVLRTRKDLRLFAAMMETTKFTQLVPCPLTLVAVPDARVRDFQGREAPPCLAAAFSRPENQKNLIRFVGRQASLGKRRDLPVGSDLPLLFGSAAKISRRGNTVMWNRVAALGEKIEFDRGVIHLLSENDARDSESKELLRRIVYWCCLHEHLLKNPNLTRFALRMVDNKRSLPILGVPPGTRPAWVARENSGWFPPPSPRAIEAPPEAQETEEKEETKETVKKETKETAERREETEDEVREGLERAEKEARERLEEAQRRFKETQDRMNEAGEEIGEEMREGLRKAEQEARDRLQQAEEEAKKLRDRLEEALKKAADRLTGNRRETEKET